MLLNKRGDTMVYMQLQQYGVSFVLFLYSRALSFMAPVQINKKYNVVSHSVKPN